MDTDDKITELKNLIVFYKKHRSSYFTELNKFPGFIAKDYFHSRANNYALLNLDTKEAFTYLFQTNYVANMHGEYQVIHTDTKIEKYDFEQMLDWLYKLTKNDLKIWLVGDYSPFYVELNKRTSDIKKLIRNQLIKEFLNGSGISLEI